MENKSFCLCHLQLNCHLRKIISKTIRMMRIISFNETAYSLDLGPEWNDHRAAFWYQKQDKWEQWLKMAAKGERKMDGEEVMGWERQTEIQLACILLPIQINPFHLRAHQLSNWESDWDVRAARISTRPGVGTPLRPNQNTIMFTARPEFCPNTLFFFPNTNTVRQMHI